MIQKNLASGKQQFTLADNLIFVTKGQIKLAYTDGEGLGETQRLNTADFLDKASHKSELPLQDLKKEMGRRTFFLKPRYQHSFPEGSEMEGYQIRAYRTSNLSNRFAVGLLLAILSGNPKFFFYKSKDIDGFKVVLEKA